MLVVTALGHREGSVKEGFGKTLGVQGRGGVEGLLTSSHWRAAPPDRPRSYPAAYETSPG